MDYSEQDPALRVATETARSLVEALTARVGPAATLGEARHHLVGWLASEIRSLESDARQDERTECIGILNAVFPPGHPAYADAHEAIRRIRGRDTQP